MNKPDWIIDNRTTYNRSQWQGQNNSHEFIVLHYLGVPNADNPNLYNDGFGGHYYVHRDGRVYWSADEDQVIWHVGASSGFKERHPNGWSPTNRNCVGIEMGVYKDNPSSTSATDNDWYYSTVTQESAVKLVAYLMKKFGIDINHVLRHGDVTTKICPAPWFNTTPANRYKTNWTWDEFKSNVKDYYNKTYGEPMADTGALYTAKLPIGIFCGMNYTSRNKIATFIWEQLMKSEVNPKTNKPYYDMGLDFSFGNGLYSASVAWQGDNGLEKDGAIGYNSWKKRLGITSKTRNTIEKTSNYLVVKFYNDDVATIKFVQSCLKARGFYKLDVDGLKGNGTNQAIIEFKESVMGIKSPNSNIDSKLLENMCGGI